MSLLPEEQGFFPSKKEKGLREKHSKRRTKNKRMIALSGGAKEQPRRRFFQGRKLASLQAKNRIKGWPPVWQKNRSKRIQFLI
ncbi:MAG TPA: hypothetical protein PKX19_03990 [Bacillota bacterium]|nr:hypothetical protein [Bacillota bacterium]